MATHAILPGNQAMAFVTHTLPTTQPPNFTQSNLPPFPPHAPPKFLPSRQRHVIQFLHQPNPSSNSNPEIPASHSNLSQRRAAAINALIQRRANRQSAIAADAAKKAQQWAETLAQLQTPPAPSLAGDPSPPQDQLHTSMAHEKTPSSVVVPPVQETPLEPSVPSDHPPNAEQDAHLASPEVEQVESDVEQPTPELDQAAPDESKTARSSVAELYGPPRTASTRVSPESDAGVPRPSVDFSAAAEKIRDVIGAAGSAAQLTLDKLAGEGKDQEKQDEIIADMFKGIAEQIKDEADLVKEGLTEEEAKAFGDKLGSMWRDGIEKIEDFAEGVVEEVEDVVEMAGETVEDLVESVGDAVDASVESGKHSDEGKAVEISDNDADETDKKTLGEKILNAIVDGVEHPDQPKVVSDEDPVDKEYVFELVTTGKIKSLTVTKLRRLLSANNLKTSGRKSELIARLTSYAKAK